MNLELTPFTYDDVGIIYGWKQLEKNHECYTCRPVKPIGSIESYTAGIRSWLSIPGTIFLLMKNKDTAEIIGEIKGFDLNTRNHSMEFGFYLPEKNRMRGCGTCIVAMFLRYMFENTTNDINKLYATTADNNEASKKVLVKNGLSLDGRNREHYWIQNQRYDQLVYSLLRKEWKEKQCTGKSGIY
jgi:[ribosomal protein S5]-alanine N-acetyltransferase